MPRRNNNTRKNGNNGKLNPLMGTMHGVQEWYVGKFEKLGWMVLAKEEGNMEKIAEYKKSIEHLLEVIEHLSGEYEDHDRKHDLAVLAKKTKCLLSFVNKNF